jgi:phosphate transport system substrate-binding protein
VFAADLNGVNAEPAPVKAAIPELRGVIRISGAWALYPMMVKWAEEFKKIHPKIRIDVSAGGAGKGAVDALSGLVDIGMVSREIRPEETQRGLVGIPVVKDAVFPTLSANNPVIDALMKKGIKKKTFVDLWISGKPFTWGDISGTGKTTKVQVYTRSDACGAAETWAKYLGKKQEDLRGVAVYGDPGLAEALRKDPSGIGYNNLNYAYDMRSGKPVPGLQILPIDVNENGKIDPNERLTTKADAITAIMSGRYPSPPARDLYVVCKGQFEGTSRPFVKWILSDGQRYVEEVGYIRITPAQVKDALKRLGK